ncbi:MAG TPA: TonB-dependent receptor [Sphingobium sp.]
MTNRALLRNSLLLSTIVLAPVTAHATVADSTRASDAAAADADSSDAIIVTATRRAENVQDVPLAITTADGATLAKLELRTAIDTARIAPNTNAWGTESRQRPRWFIRGIGSNDASSNVVTPIAIYNDEVYLNHFSLQGFPLFDIERVEVLRGPGGTLWGKNTTGGAFSFVSRRPTDEPEGYARATIGNYGTRLLEGAFGGPVSDIVTARASFLYDRRDGFTTNDTTGNTVGGVRDFAGRLQVQVKPSSDLSILFNGHYRNFRGGNNAVYAIGTSAGGVDTFGYPTPTDRDHVRYNVDEVADIDAAGGSARVEWDLGNVALTSITAYEQADRSEFTDGDKTPNEISRTYASTNVEQISQELRLASDDNGPLQWILGAYYFHDKLRSFGATGTLPGALNRPLAYYYTRFTQKTTSTAIFANATYRFNDWLSLNGGLRYTWDRLSINLLSQRATPGTTVAFSDTTNWYLPSSVSSPISNFATQVDTQKWSSLGYEIRPEIRVNKDVLLFARFSKGYRSGNFQGNIAPPSTLPNVIQPEKVYAYEAGFKTTLLDRKLTFNGTAFYYDYKNIQTTVTTLIPATINTPAATISQVREAQGWVEGAEFELVAAPVENLRLTGNLGLLKTRYTDLLNNGVQLAGNEFARAPHVTAYIAADYRIPFGVHGVTLGTDWRYNSLFRLNALTQNNDQFDVRPYWVGNVRLSVGLNDDRITGTFFINNVTDKDYKIHTLPASNGSFKRYLGEPRTYGFTLGAKF